MRLDFFSSTTFVVRVVRDGGRRGSGEINILLCGDPGTSKSQTLQYVHKLAPRGIYTSGKGSTAVGLTAYVTKDPDTKQFVLERSVAGERASMGRVAICAATGAHIRAGTGLAVRSRTGARWLRLAAARSC